MPSSHYSGLWKNIPRCLPQIQMALTGRIRNAGLLDSLLGALPPEIARARRRIVVNGNAVRKSPLMLRLLRERMPEHEILLPDTREEAACGAALYALRSGMRECPVNFPG